MMYTLILLGVVLVPLCDLRANEPAPRSYNDEDALIASSSLFINVFKSTLEQALVDQGSLGQWREPIDSPFLQAVADGDISKVKVFSEEISELGGKALRIASQNGHAEVLRHLLSLNIGPEAIDSHKRTPLHIAVLNGHMECVKALIEANGNVNVEDSHYQTPLHFSVLQEKIELMDLLIQKAANLDSTNHKGATPLSWAVALDKYEMMIHLINKGASTTPRHKSSKHLIITALLGKAVKCRDYLVKNVSLDELDHRGHTPLQAAVKYLDIQAIRYLIESGANISLITKTKETLLHLATKNPKSEILPFILDDKRNPNLKIYINEKDDKGLTPLHLASLEGNVEWQRLLIDKGAKFDIPCATGCTALHFAAASDNPDSVKLLLDHGADINVQNFEGYTPLFKAAIQRKPLALEFLLKAGASTEIKDIHQQTPLNAAIFMRNQSCAELLVNYGADVNGIGKSGYSPLHEAVHTGDVKIARLLLDKGANVNTLNNANKTALQIAIEKSHDEVAHLLGAASNVDASAIESQLKEIRLSKSIEPADYCFRRSLIDGDVEKLIHYFSQGYIINDRALAKNLGNVESVLYFVATNIIKNRAKVMEAIIQYYKENELKLPSDKKEILSRVIDDRSKEQYYGTTLHPFIQDLIDLGAIVNTPPYTTSPLHVAASKGYLDVVKVLVKNGADLMHLDTSKKTPFGVAMDNGHREVAMELMSHAGVNPETIKKKINITRSPATTQGIAVLNPNAPSFNPFPSPSNHGIDASVLPPMSQSIINHNQLGQPDSSNADLGKTVHIECSEQPKELSSSIVMIHKAEDIPTESPQISSPIAKVADTSIPQQQPSNFYQSLKNSLINQGVLGLYVHKGSNLLSQATSEGNFGLVKKYWPRVHSLSYKREFMLDAILGIAAQNGFPEIVKFIIEKGVNPNPSNPEQIAPLLLAALNNNLECVEHLVKVGAHVNIQDDFGQTPLHYAVFTGNLELVERLVFLGANVDTPNNLGQTPLHWSLHGKPEITRLLIKSGANLEKEDNLGNTIFHMSVTARNPEIVKEMHEQNSLINKQNSDSQTPLHLAVINVFPEIIENLLLSGADIESRDYNRQTPLMKSSQKSDLECLRILLNNQANIEARDSMGRTVLNSVAIIYNPNLAFIKLLIESGADINTMDEQKSTPLHKAAQFNQIEVVKLLLDSGASTKSRNFKGQTPYDVATLLENVSIAKLIENHESGTISLEAIFNESVVNSMRSEIMDSQNTQTVEIAVPSVNQVTSAVSDKHPEVLVETGGNSKEIREKLSNSVQGKETPLIANMVDSSIFHQQPIKYTKKIENSLIKQGILGLFVPEEASPLTKAISEGNLELVTKLWPDDITQSDPWDASFNSNLRIAAQNGFPEILDFLIRKGLDPNTSNHGLIKPLHLAALNNNLECVELLIKANADVNIQDGFGQTPLHFAVLSGNLEIVERLISCGANVNSITKIDQTPLHWSLHGKPEITRLLVYNGAFYANADKHGNTSLHISVAARNVEFTSLMLEVTPFLETKNIENQTPLHLAALNGFPEIIEILLQAGANIESRDYNRQTPLIKSCQKADVECLRILLNSQADIEARDSMGRTVLNSKVNGGNDNLAFVKLLIESGADINTMDEQKSTPLHKAARSNRYEVVKLLLDNGANTKCRNFKRQTPYDVAISHENVSIATLIKNHESKVRRRQTIINQPAINPEISESNGSPAKGTEVYSEKLDCKTELNFSEKTYTKEDFTKAIKEKKYDFLNYCLESKVLDSLKLNDSPLFYAVTHGDRESLRWFLKRGFDQEARLIAALDHPTPFIYAASLGKYSLLPEFNNWKERLKTEFTLPEKNHKKPKCVVDILFGIDKPNENLSMNLRCLLDAGLSLNEDLLDELGAPILTQLVKSNSDENLTIYERNRLCLIQELISVGASSDVKDSEGYTPILRAAESQNINLVLFMSFILNCDVEVTTPCGLSIRDLLNPEKREFFTSFTAHHKQIMKTSPYSFEDWESVNFTASVEDHMICKIYPNPMNIPITLTHSGDSFEYITLLKNCLLNSWRNPLSNELLHFTQIKVNKDLQRRIHSLVAKVPKMEALHARAKGKERMPS